MNGFIHSEQLKYINRIIKKDEELKKFVYDDIILNDDGYDEGKFRNSLDELIQILKAESPKMQVKLKKKIIKIMCYDGTFDETEKNMLQYIFGNNNYSKLSVFFISIVLILLFRVLP